MVGMYGHKWESQYGAEVSATWVMGLSDISGDELSAGLRGCLKRSEGSRRSGDEDWPPTLGEFRILCRPTPYPYRNTQLSLPAPKLSDEQKAEIRADMKRLKKVLREAQAEDDARVRARLLERRRVTRMSLSQMHQGDYHERVPGSDDDVDDTAGAPGTENK